MPPSSSPLAHKDIENAMSRAISNGIGVRIFCPGGLGDAKHLQQRAYRCRIIDRKENQRIYSEDHPMYGRSTYDSLVITARQAEDETWFLYIEVSTPERLEQY